MKRSATSTASPAPAAAPALAAPLAWGMIASAGVALLAIALGPHRVGDYYTETDFYGGYAVGARLLQHGVFDASRYGVSGPGFDAALALVGFVTRNLFTAGALIAWVSAVGTLALWFTLLRARAGVVTAAWTTALLAANAIFFRYGYSVTTDAMALALEALALHLAFAHRERPRLFLAGACVALAAMTRYTAVALLPIVVLAPAFAPAADARTRVRGPLLALAGFALVALPFVAASLAQHHVPGELLFHNVAYDTFASGRGRTLADYQSSAQPQLHSLGDVIARDPGAVAARQFGNALSHVRGDARDLLGWPAAAAAALGLVLLAVTRRARLAGPLALAGLAIYVALVPAPASARYSLALLPFYLALAGLALGSPELPFARWRLRLAPLAGVALLALALVGNVRAQRETLSLLPTEVLPMAKALRDVPLAERRVMALKPHVAWHADAVFVPFPNAATVESLAAVCRQADARYLYVSWIETNNRPAFWWLLDPESPVAGLHAVASTATPGAVLYRIAPGFGVTPAWLADDAARSAAAARFLARMPGALNGRAHLTLAIWARAHQQFADVATHARAALDADPSQGYAWRLLGDAQLASGDQAGAVHSLQQAIALVPQDVDARLALGWVYMASGEPAGAAEVWRPIVGVTTHRPTLERMAALYHERGEEALAERARAALLRLPR